MKVTPLVRRVLKNYIETRNDDNLLVKKVWEIQGAKVFETDGQLALLITDDVFEKLFGVESVTRARRKIQHTDKEYLPTDLEVVKRRKIREEEFRNYYGDIARLSE